ncbi:MAG: hypothetical protein ACXVJD_05880 [Mucilaginibacter sp.]
MEKFKISVSKDKEIFQFEVADYLHHEDGHCKFEVFQNGEFVAAFQPDSHEYLRICKNPGILDEEVLYLLADQIEAHNL